MKNGLLVGTIAGLMLGTSAFAQSPSDQQRTNAPSTVQGQTPKGEPSKAGQSNTAPADQNAQSGKTEQAPTNSTVDSSRSQAQPNQPAASSQTQSTQQPGSQPAQAQSNTPPANNQSTGTQQSTGPANTNNANTNSRTNGGAAQPSTNTAAQPSNNQTNTAQSQTNVNVSANLSQSQRIRVSESISRLNAKPVTNVNFSLSVGTVVPRGVRFQPLPAAVVEVMPQYRGYSFILVREDIVIVEPSTSRIVDVLPRGGKSTAAAPTPRKATFSDSDREVVRKHARSSRIEQRSDRTERRTTGSATSTRVRVGDRLPESVEIRTFPDEVYREAPRLREYHYIERDSRTYIIEPGERRIIEEID